MEQKTSKWVGVRARAGRALGEMSTGSSSPEEGSPGWLNRDVIDWGAHRCPLEAVGRTW